MPSAKSRSRKRDIPLSLQGMEIGPVGVQRQEGIALLVGRGRQGVERETEQQRGQITAQGSS